MNISQNQNKLLHLILKIYENYNINYKNISYLNSIKCIIGESTYLVITKDKQIKYIEQHSEINNKRHEKVIFYIKNKVKNSYSLVNPIPSYIKKNENNINDLKQKMWYLLESNPINEQKINETYILNQNDIIRFGKVIYAVQKIHIENKNKIIEIDNNNNYQNEINCYNINSLNKNTLPVFDYIYKVKNYSLENKKKCLICLSNNETDDMNPLINLCNCEELYHYKCLKTYLNEYKLTKIIKSSISTYKINFKCQICLRELPLKFQIPGINKTFHLLDLEKPNDCDYIILESLIYDPNNLALKYIHIIKLIKDFINIGRKDNNDLIIGHNSISRNHAKLIYMKDNKKIILKNRSRTFGSLVLIKKPIQMVNSKIHLQVGNIFIEAN